MSVSEPTTPPTTVAPSTISRSARWAASPVAPYIGLSAVLLALLVVNVATEPTSRLGPT